MKKDQITQVIVGELRQIMRRKPGGGRKAKTAGAKRVPLSTCLDSRAHAELCRRVAESGLSLPDWLSREYMPRDPAEPVVSWSR